MTIYCWDFQIVDECLELCWVDFVDNIMNIVWWGEYVDVDKLMIMNDNLSLQSSLCVGRDNYILWEFFFCFWKIVSCFETLPMSSMLELCLAKATPSSCLVGYLPENHLYILTLNGMLKGWDLTLNDMSECWELFLRRISDPFSVYMMDCCWWWNLDPWDRSWVRWWASQPTLRREGNARAHGCVFQERKMCGVATNVYSRKS